MSYLTQDAIASSTSMQHRVAQSYASQHNDPAYDPDRWVLTNRRYWAAAPGWDAAWESALAGHPDDPSYDPGQDEAVITDDQILSQVQSMIPPVIVPQP